jgi:hypothetical protein
MQKSAMCFENSQTMGLGMGLDVFPGASGQDVLYG